MAPDALVAHWREDRNGSRQTALGWYLGKRKVSPQMRREAPKQELRSGGLH
jgi:hypothetical protein